MKPIVFIIEPNAALRFILQTVVGYKYRSKAFTDFNQAMQHENFADVAAFIIDIQHEDQDEYAFFMHLRSSACTVTCPTIIISNNNEALFVDKCLKMGAHNYFHKPFDPLDLLKSLQQVLDINISTIKLHHELLN